MLFVVLSGGDDDEGDRTTTATVASEATTIADAPESLTVASGEPVGGVKRLTYQRGDLVRVEVMVDASVEEIHVHGYEVTEPAANSPVRLSFPADIDGLFEIEAHLADGADAQIAELRVNP